MKEKIRGEMSHTQAELIAHLNSLFLEESEGLSQDSPVDNCFNNEVKAKEEVVLISKKKEKEIYPSKNKNFPGTLSPYRTNRHFLTPQVNNASVCFLNKIVEICNVYDFSKEIFEKLFSKRSEVLIWDSKNPAPFLKKEELFDNFQLKIFLVFNKKGIEESISLRFLPNAEVPGDILCDEFRNLVSFEYIDLVNDQKYFRQTAEMALLFFKRATNLTGIKRMLKIAWFSIN